MPAQFVVNGRYDIRDTLGQGGMGVVFRAYDTATKRDVALKTMRGGTDPVTLRLFAKEWTVLAGLSHPNIVDILDCGEFDDAEGRRPYFVMPLLPGRTLDDLIRKSSQRLTVERTVEILVQTCRGLQAAHERGLVHRDLKPSNIFVMEDDTAKIIDFGVVHLADSQSASGIKGTLQYMAPEQLDLKPATPQSDIFSLGVTAYEALTGRKPFARASEDETAEAVRSHIPPAASEVNAAVNELLSRVVHKAMAKQPWHRFDSARELAEALKKAVRNEPIEKFERSRILPRLERAKRAFSEGDLQFAEEILGELQAEGNLDPDMALLRMQLDQATRQRTIRQLLENARIRFEQDEYPLALQKLQEVLQIDPDNVDAMRMGSEIESQRSERQLENWVRLAREHLHSGAFEAARKSIDEALKLSPNDSMVKGLLAEVARQEEQTAKARAQKDQLYQAAKVAFRNGEISTALSKLERILEINREIPDRAFPDRDALYQTLYNRVRTERDSIRSLYEEARRELAAKEFGKALAICDGYLKKYPGQALFQALRLEITEQERQELSTCIAETARLLDAQPDLDRKLAIVKAAMERYPKEPHFQATLRLVRERRDLVLSIVAKARQYVERGQFAEAIAQWQIVRSVYPPYPGLAFEIEQLERRRDLQAREEAKARLVEQIDRALEFGKFERARDIAAQALTEHPGDAGIVELERLSREGLERRAEAQRLFEEGRALCAEGAFPDGIAALRRAAELDTFDTAVRATLVNVLVEYAQTLVDTRWPDAEPLVLEALEIEPSHVAGKSLRAVIKYKRNKEAVDRCLADARALQARGEFEAAIALVDQTLATSANDARLLQLRTTLESSARAAHEIKRKLDLAELRRLASEASTAVESETCTSILEQARPIASRYTGDPEFGSILRDLERRVECPTAAEKTRLFADTPTPPALDAAVGAGVDTPPPTAVVRPEAAAESLIPAAPVRPARLPVRERILARLRWRLGALIAVPVIVFGALVALLLHRVSTPPKPPTLPGYPVTIRTNVPAAAIRVDGRLMESTSFRLAAGPHTVDVTCEGYRPQHLQIVARRDPAPEVITLQPAPQRLHLVTALASGKLILDGREAGDLVAGEIWKDDIAAAEHTLWVKDRGSAVLEVRFRSGVAALAEVVAPVKTPNLLVVSSLGSRLRVYAGPGAMKVSLKDRPLQTVPAEGLPFLNLPPDSQLTVNNGKSNRTIPVDSGDAPSLAVYLGDAAQITPVLTIRTNVQDPSLFIDGKAVKWLMYGDRLAGHLNPGKYKIKLAKDGYLEEEATADLTAGDLAVKLDLKPAPTVASLLIEDGTPGAEVYIDGTLSGTLDEHGELRLENISPGQHDVSLRKTHFERRDVGKHSFAAGQAIRITAAGAKLEPFGILELEVTPPEAEISYRRESETEYTAAHGREIPVRAGRYRINAKADRYQAKEVPATVEAGKRATVRLPLVPRIPEPAPLPPKPQPPQSLFDKTWTQDSEGTWQYNGPGYGWLQSNRGTFSLTIRRKRGNFMGMGGSIEWVVGHVNDGRNQVVYRLGKDGALRRQVMVDGRPESEVRVRKRLGGDDAFQFQIVIESNGIIVRDETGEVIDDCPESKWDFTKGRFGFRSGVRLSATQSR